MKIKISCSHPENLLFFFKTLMNDGNVVFIIIFGLNRALELERIDKGEMVLIGNVKEEVLRKLPSHQKGKMNALHGKLPNVVHITIHAILSRGCV